MQTGRRVTRGAIVYRPRHASRRLRSLMLRQLRRP